MKTLSSVWFPIINQFCKKLKSSLFQTKTGMQSNAKTRKQNKKSNSKKGNQSKKKKKRKQDNNKSKTKKGTQSKKKSIDRKLLFLGGVTGNGSNSIVSVQDEKIKICTNALPNPPVMIGTTAVVMSSGNIMVCGEKKLEKANKCYQFDYRKVKMRQEKN